MVKASPTSAPGSIPKHTQRESTPMGLNTREAGEWAARTWTLLVIALTTLLLAPAALAQVSADSDSTAGDPLGQTRFQTTVETLGVSVRLVRPTAGPGDARMDHWVLEVVTANEPHASLCSLEVELDVGGLGLDYEVVARPVTSKSHILLFEAAGSKERRTPLGAPEFQVAWHLKPGAGRTAGTTAAGKWDCTVIAEAEFSELDGGVRLTFDELPAATGGLYQLLRTDTAAEAQFCDARPKEDRSLQVYDPSSEAFLDQRDVTVFSRNATPLVAVLPEHAFQDPHLTGYYSWAWATSDRRAQTETANIIRPRALGDLDLTTAWAEGTPGSGAGEYVTANINDALPLRGVRIFPGNGAGAAQHRAFARPTKVLIALSGVRYTVELPKNIGFDTLKAHGGLVVEFPKPVTSRCMSVVVLESAPGSGQPDVRHATAFSEITPIAVVHDQTIDGTARNIVNFIADEPSLRRRDSVIRLAVLMNEALVAAIRDAFPSATGEGRSRIIPILASLPPQTALPLLLAIFQTTESEAPEYRAIKRTLAAHGPAAGERLLAALDSLPLESKKHKDAIRLLGRIGSQPQLQALIGDLGKGSDGLRVERVRAVANGGVDLAGPLIEKSLEGIDQPAGADALHALNLLGRRHFRHEQARVNGSEVLLEIVRQSRDRRTVMRALLALGFLRTDGALELLDEHVLRAHNDPLIRSAAAEALQRYPEARARQALARALSDDSPDVRIAAISGLASRSDRELAVESVLEYASQETWDQGLHHAYLILSQADDFPETLDFLEGVIAEDVAAPNAIAAIRALKRAGRALPPATIRDMLLDEDATLSARRQLVDLLGHDATAAGEELLMQLVGGEPPFTALLEGDDGPVIYRQALLGLGMRRSPAARTMFFDILRSDIGIETGRAALRALAFYNDPNVVRELQIWAPEAPTELRGALRETITMIQNRLAVDELVDDVEDIMEAIDELDLGPSDGDMEPKKRP